MQGLIIEEGKFISGAGAKGPSVNKYNSMGKAANRTPPATKKYGGRSSLGSQGGPAPQETSYQCATRAVCEARICCAGGSGGCLSRGFVALLRGGQQVPPPPPEPDGARRGAAAESIGRFSCSTCDIPVLRAIWPFTLENLCYFFFPLQK